MVEPIQLWPDTGGATIVWKRLGMSTNRRYSGKSARKKRKARRSGAKRGV